MTGSPRTRAGLTAAAAMLLALLPAAGCRSGGDFTLFGYSTAPNFDPNIRSVYVPEFKNIAFHTSPYRGIEVDITEAVVRELNARRTPMRVVQDPARADTELIGTVTRIDKSVLNRNLQNLNREIDVVIAVDIVWRDLRTGKVLTGTRVPAPRPEDCPIDPTVPQPPPPPPDGIPVPVTVTATGRVIPEVGESNATGAKLAVDKLARQIVDRMEQPW